MCVQFEGVCFPHVGSVSETQVTRLGVMCFALPHEPPLRQFHAALDHTLDMQPKIILPMPPRCWIPAVFDCPGLSHYPKKNHLHFCTRVWIALLRSSWLPWLWVELRNYWIFVIHSCCVLTVCPSYLWASGCLSPLLPTDYGHVRSPCRLIAPNAFLLSVLFCPVSPLPFLVMGTMYLTWVWPCLNDSHCLWEDTGEQHCANLASQPQVASC